MATVADQFVHIEIVNGKLAMQTSLELQDGRGQIQVLRAIAWAERVVKAWDPPEPEIVAPPVAPRRILGADGTPA